MDQKIYDISVDQIQVSDLDVRHSQREKEVADLAKSIDRLGQLQPVVLLGHRKQEPPYQLIIGQRRYEAIRFLGLPNVRAVFAGALSPVDAKKRSLAENMLRVPLNHADAADAVTELYKELGSIDDVHDATGVSQKMIRKYLDVRARASDPMLERLRAEEVKVDDIRRCLDAAKDDIAKAERLLDRIADTDLSQPEKSRLVEYGQTHPSASADEILKEAQRPRVEARQTVRLPEAVRQGLESAVAHFEMEASEVLTLALQEWLADQGFMDAE